MAGPHGRGSDAAGVGWGLRVCISNKISGDADTAGLGSCFENHRVSAYNMGRGSSSISPRPLVSEFPRVHCKNMGSWPPEQTYSIWNRPCEMRQPQGFPRTLMRPVVMSSLLRLNPSARTPVGTGSSRPAKQPNSDHQTGFIRLSPSCLPAILLLGPTTASSTQQ